MPPSFSSYNDFEIKMDSAMHRMRRRQRHEVNGHDSHKYSIDSTLEGEKTSKQGVNSGIIGMMKRRWSLMNKSQRLATTISLLFLTSFVSIGVLDFLQQSEGIDTSKRVSKKRTEESYSIVLNTYKRPELLRKAVRHYADSCGKKYGVKEVFIMWGDLDTEPPEVGSFFESNTRGGDMAKTQNQNRAKMTMVRLEKDSLNSRFTPVNDVDGDVVFTVDDDVRVDCPSLLKGFYAWKASPDSLVGYYPRLLGPPRVKRQDNSLVYYSWPTVLLRQQMNLVLTKASFMHEKYLRLYLSSVHPQEIRDYVDKNKNCEDIAMAMLIANQTKDELGTPAFPIYVEGAVSDDGLFNGISRMKAGYMSSRSDCATDLTRIYLKHGWGSPLSHVAPLRESSWIKHYPGYWWQAKPSNIFEWFAVQNVLT